MKRFILMLIVSLLLTGCSNDTTEVIDYTPVVKHVSKNTTRVSVSRNVTHTLSENCFTSKECKWSCSVNATYVFDDREYYYDFDTNFETDGDITRFEKTTKFLGNYGLLPIAVTPATTSTNTIELDLSPYLEEKVYTISSNDLNEYPWYFFSCEDLRGVQFSKANESHITLGDFNMWVKVVTNTDGTVSEVEMHNMNTVGSLKHVNIILKRCIDG